MAVFALQSKEVMPIELWSFAYNIIVFKFIVVLKEVPFRIPFSW